jgi:hypothetical protein
LDDVRQLMSKDMLARWPAGGRAEHDIVPARERRGPDLGGGLMCLGSIVHARTIELRHPQRRSEALALVVR